MYVEDSMDKYRIKPGQHVRMSDWDANAKEGDKDVADEELDRLDDQLSDLQELLYAEHKHAFLVVLQALDTGGKDGTIEHVFHGVNPQGVAVASFKVPTPLERSHDFLWREHMEAPAKGEIVIFNRSHYESVLVERVHNLTPQSEWEKRYGEINAFEEMLANEGTTIRKFYLNISKDEQKKRLQARLDDPNKQWKFDPNDLKERALWDEYMKAYEDALSKTSTEWAPWYIVPANHKWYRNLIISRVLVETLQSLNMSYPHPDFDPEKIRIE